jgi:hypothetical protein
MSSGAQVISLPQYALARSAAACAAVVPPLLLPLPLLLLPLPPLLPPLLLPVPPSVPLPVVTVHATTRHVPTKAPAILFSMIALPKVALESNAKVQAGKDAKRPPPTKERRKEGFSLSPGDLESTVVDTLASTRDVTCRLVTSTCSAAA